MTTEEFVRCIGYTKLWFEHGFVSDDLLMEQLEFWETGEDTNAEHYRWGAFHRWFSARACICDDDLTAWLQIAEEDDQCGDSFLHSLLTCPLTPEQFARVASHASLRGMASLLRLVARVRLLQRLETEELTDDLFDLCLYSGDGPLHVALFDKDLSLSQLDALVTHGRNKEIRHHANQRRQKLRRFILGH